MSSAYEGRQSLSLAKNDTNENDSKSTTPLSRTSNGDVELEPANATGAREPPTSAPGPQFPEGGLWGWATVAGGSLVLSCTFGAIQAFGVYQDFYTQTYLNNKSPSAISWIGSMQTFWLFAVGLPAGKLFDEGYFHHCLIGGSLLYLFSTFMLSLAKPHQYYQIFLSQGVGMGIAMGIMFLPCLSIIAHYFQRRRAFAQGIVLAGTSVGAVIYPILLNNLFGKKGFGEAIRAASYLDLGFLLVANLLMRTRLPSRKHRPPGKPVDMKGVFGDVAYWLNIAGAVLVFWGLFVPVFYIQLYADLHHVNTDLARYSISLLNAGGFFGRTVPNYLADRWGNFNVMIPCTLLTAGLVFGMFGASTKAGLIVFSLAYGFFAGGFTSIIVPATGAFSRDLNEIGLRIGILSFVCSFPLLTGNPIAGSLLNPPEYQWWRPLVFSAVVMFGGCVFFVVSRQMMVARRNSQRV